MRIEDISGHVEGSKIQVSLREMYASLVCTRGVGMQHTREIVEIHCGACVSI